MLPLVKIGRILSLLVCFSPLIWFVGGSIVTTKLSSDSSGFGFAVFFYGLPSIIAAVVYYFLVHKPIARARMELQANPQKELSGRVIVSLVVMALIFLHVALAMGYALVGEIVQYRWEQQYHKEHCEKFPEQIDCL